MMDAAGAPIVSRHFVQHEQIEHHGRNTDRHTIIRPPSAFLRRVVRAGKGLSSGGRGVHAPRITLTACRGHRRLADMRNYYE
jgi:hypothetical protein